MTSAELDILVVDSSPQDRAAYRRFFAGDPLYHCTIRETGLGQEGIRLCTAKAPDCLLLDHRLPDMDGLEFLRSLALRPGQETISVIMLTGQGSEAIAVEALKSGALDYLVKDEVTAERLRSAVRNAVEKVAVRRRFEQQRRDLEDLAEQRAHLIARLEQRAQELLEAANRKDEFLAMLAHELRNPLAPICTAVQVLKKGNFGDKVLQDARDVIDRQATHMARLIDDLLDVSRISRGKILLRKEPVDVVALVRRTVDDHRRYLEDGGLRISLSLPDSPLWLFGDATRLSQVVGNILHNAAKFTNAGGQVTVAVEADAGGKNAILTIRDTGIGMDARTMGRVFEPFAQADNSRDRSQGGLGLGLALVKGLVKMHGGEASAASEGLGKGAEFSLRLPLSAPASPNGPPDASAAPKKSFRILLIEDNKDSAETLKTLLQLIGNTVEVAHDGLSGVEAALRFSPEIVICDIGLPGGMNGYAVARALRQEPATAATYLIALTGYGREEDQASAHESGFDLHLIKPVRLAQLQKIFASIPQAAGSNSERALRS